MNELARGTSQTSQTSGRVSDTDYASWLTKAEAAAAIGVTTKTVERLAEKGTIQQRLTQRQGRGPTLAVYQPDDVVRVAQERRQSPAAFVLPAGVTSPVNGNGHSIPNALALSPQAQPPGDDVLRLVFAAALRAVSETSETPTTVYLDVDQAAAFLNWTPRDLRRAIRAGDVPTRNKERRDWRTWRIRRKDLEAL